MFKVSSSLFGTLIYFGTVQELQVKTLPCVSPIDYSILRECLCAFLPLAPSAHCKLIPYVYWTRGLRVTSKYERAVVRELQGAHLNSPSV